MNVIAFTSPGDAPGLTTMAFAMALAWPSRVLLAECAPEGGQILRGHFQCHTPPTGGLWDLALAAVHGPDISTSAIWDQTIPLDEQRQRLLLPGLFDPFLAEELSPATWENLASTFADLPFCVLADTGPIGPRQPFALLRAAQLVIVVMRPTLAQVAAARPRLGRLRQALGTTTPLGLCLIGEHPYTARDVRAHLGEFDLNLLVPKDTKAAAVLSQGGGSDWIRRRIEMTPLMRAARSAAHTTAHFAAARHQPPAEPNPVAAMTVIPGGRQ